MGVDKGVLSNDLSAIRDAFEINFYGTIQATLAFLPLVRKAPKGHGVLVFNSTDMASNSFMATPQGFAHQFPAYNTSKAAMNSWVIALARTLKDEGAEIKVNAITPGFTTTKLNGNLPGGNTTEKSASLLLPLALLGPEDKDTHGMCYSTARVYVKVTESNPTGKFFDEKGEFPW